MENPLDVILARLLEVQREVEQFGNESLARGRLPEVFELGAVHFKLEELIRDLREEEL